MHSLQLDFGGGGHGVGTRIQQAGWALYKGQGLSRATRTFCICRVYVKTTNPSFPLTASRSVYRKGQLLSLLVSDSRLRNVGFTLLGEQGEQSLGQMAVLENRSGRQFLCLPQSVCAADCIHNWPYHDHSSLRSLRREQQR